MATALPPSASPGTKGRKHHVQQCEILLRSNWVTEVPEPNLVRSDGERPLRTKWLTESDLIPVRRPRHSRWHRHRQNHAYEREPGGGRSHRGRLDTQFRMEA